LTLRSRVAQALAPRDAEAIPVLIELIALLPVEQSGQVHDFLSPLAGDSPPRGPSDEKSRKKASEDWNDWWKGNGAKAELTKPVPNDGSFLGYTVICEVNGGRVLELGRDRKQRWMIQGLQGPVDALVLPNNQVVIAENHGNKISQRDMKGNIIWS